MIMPPLTRRPIAALALLLLAVAALASGCVSVAYEHPSGAKARYTRLGSQEVQGLSIVHGDTLIEIQSSAGSGADLIEAAARGLSAGVR